MAELTGIVEPGRGFGAARMADSSVLHQIRELVGLSVVPGTLNVRLPQPLDRSLTPSYLAAAEIGPDWEAETGQAGYFWVGVLIADRYRGVAAQADEPGYPDDLVEILSEVHLRQTLGLSNGDPMSVALRSGGVTAASLGGMQGRPYERNI